MIIMYFILKYANKKRAMMIMMKKIQKELKYVDSICTFFSSFKRKRKMRKKV